MGTPYLSLYQINTRVWLTALASDLGRPGTLDDIPDADLDDLAREGFDWIWMLSVWQTGPAARRVSRSNHEWRHEFEQTLPDLRDEDIAGSGFAITDYTVHDALGGNAALARLRSGRGLGFGSREEILAAARAAVARAEEAVPDWFGLRHQAPCEVVPTPAHEEAHSSPVQYRLGAEDGSRPGRFWITTSEPGSRQRFLLEVQSFHEAVPGHHLQLEVAQQLSGLPKFRRRAIVEGYAEGWGLYAEHLAGDMQLFSTDLDRLGARSQDALRSCRLVVDTGLHALGWTRQQAIDFMASNTALSLHEVTTEIDRYIAWPGQALGYKMGELKIRELRARAESARGARFDLREFHDVVLRNGSVPLDVLEEEVADYLGENPRGRTGSIISVR